MVVMLLSVRIFLLIVHTKDEENHKSAKGAANHTMSVGEISKLYALRDQNQDSKNSPTSQKPSHQTLASRSILPAPVKGKAKKHQPLILGVVMVIQSPCSTRIPKLIEDIALRYLRRKKM
ncbi:hypothetical protein KIW84_022923 [Lathyrus oleraceus]|uniref:Uncharacterized protein n=1 Tax=Pisum sativum TaxID=3888 RepID=A0A9D4YCU7_PEA|nr:hypothetical protein KIW84_022923 [Pisum sativum]